MAHIALSRRSGKNAYAFILGVAFLIVALAGLTGCGERQLLSDPEEPAKEAPPS